MDKTVSRRRMAENEVVFRRYNERVQAGFAEIRHIAKEEHQEHMVAEITIPLHFYCECSDEECKERIQLQPDHYTRIHENRDRFIILSGHEAKQVEEVVYAGSDYSIVQKRLSPNAQAAELNATAFSAPDA